MKRLNPFFEVDKVIYEIKPTRYLIAEYDKLSEESGLSSEEKANAVKIQKIIENVQKYAQKTKELEDVYFETFDDEDERKYLKAKALYEKELENLAKNEIENGSTQKLQNETFRLLEQIAIKGLAEQHFGMDFEKATEVWCKFVDSCPNHDFVAEWLSAMADCLFSSDEEEDDNSFLSKKKKLDEERAKNRTKMQRK